MMSSRVLPITAWVQPLKPLYKQIAGMKTVQSAPTINKANGSPCDSPDEILQRWREHFESALNHLPGTNSAELDAEQINATTDPDIYQLTNHHWTRLPVPSANYKMVVQTALVGFYPSYSNVQLIRSQRLCTKSSSRSGEQDT